jgi:hypothetical protein
MSQEHEGLIQRLLHRSERRTSTPAALNLEDIQGFILRGYRMPMVRHFLLKVRVPAEARRLLGRLVSGNEADAPQITTAQNWHVGFEPGPADNPSDAPTSNLTIASTSASPGPGCWHWK